MGMWVGTYEKKGGGGLYPLATNAGLTLGTPEPAIRNASHGVWCEEFRTAYFVEEQEAGRVAAWRRENDRWTFLSAIESGGGMPCYVSLAPDRRHLGVANYADGAVALLELDPATGGLFRCRDVARQPGRGPHPERQTGPHAHCAIFDEDGSHLFHVDLGLDRIFAYAIDGGKLTQAWTAFEAPAGSGPRHLLLDPDGQHALLLCELSAELMLLARAASGFACIDRILISDKNPASGNLGGHLALDDDGRVFVTSRGKDEIVAFTHDGARLRREGAQRTGGSSPRHFLLTAGDPIVANEVSGTVCRLRADAGGAPLTQRVPGAAFLINISEPLE